MKKQYVFTENEYDILKSKTFNAFRIMCRLKNNNFYSGDIDSIITDLRYAIDILNGVINLKDDV